MKKKILSLISVLSLLFGSALTCSAQEILASGAADSSRFNFYMISNSFKNCTSAQVAAIFAAAVILLTIIFRKKLVKKLNNSSSSAMINAFIVFFSVFGIACLALGFASEGETWSALMHIEESKRAIYTHFDDYILTIQSTGRQDFLECAGQFTPFGQLLYFTIAQFLPTKLVLSDSLLSYAIILKNQTFMFLYLILVMFCITLVYRMNRSVLRRNSLNMRDEIVAFMTVVSYPTMYCVELGNINAICIALALFFAVYYNSEQKIIRELSHLTMGISAAIMPSTILFSLLLFNKENKKSSLINIAKIAGYALILFTAPCVLTGFDCMRVYMQNFLAINADSFVLSNMSISNLLLFLGVENKPVLHIVSIAMNIVAAAAIVILPKTWQKLSAAVYIMLNIFAFSSPVSLVLVFIPLMFLLAEKTHKTTDWIYLLVFALMVTPFPEWFYFDRSDFNMFTLSFGIREIYNANNLISLAAVQGLFLIFTCQAVKQLASCKKSKTAAEK